ncbi:hypothetical protein ERJ75_000685100 [Trypanosoma vivax]|nr:hypothetical protein ERJ75_000685100 [Trypanosoma vivax]
MTCGQRVRAVHAESDACLSAGASESRHLRGRRRHKRKDAAYVLIALACACCWRGRARARRRRRASRSTPRGAVQHSDGARGDQRGSGERSGRHEAAARLFEQLEARGQRGERGDTELDGGGEAEKLGASRRAWATLSTRHSQSRGRGTHKRAPDRLRQALRDILRQASTAAGNMHR